MRTFIRIALLIFTVKALTAQTVSNLVVEYTVPTQVVFSYSVSTTAACSIMVSESSSYSPLAYDVDPALFAGSNLDSNRAVIGAGVAGVRRVVIGKRNSESSGGVMYSRALAAETSYFLKVTCGSSVAETAFKTTFPQGVYPEEPPYSASGDGGYGFPDWDWTDRNKPVIDPQTGLKLYRVNDPSDVSSNDSGTWDSGIFFGGTGWVNPGNITSGVVGTLASSANVNPIFLPYNGLASTNTRDNSNGFLANDMRGGSLYDMAVRLFGSGTDANSANRQVGVCLSIDSGNSCYTNEIAVTLPQTTAAEVGTFWGSNASPTAWFSGWGKSIKRDFAGSSSGYVTVASGVVTLNKAYDGSDIGLYDWSAESYFHPEWGTGVRIFIAGSSPTCANNYCTIASYQSKTRLTLSEVGLNLASNALYRMAHFGVRMRKLTAVGTISLSSDFRIAKTRPSLIITDHCSSLSVSTSVTRNGSPLASPVTGRLCAFPRWQGSTGDVQELWFIGESTIDNRLVSVLPVPTVIAGYGPEDMPAIGGYNQAQVYFSTTAPNVMYAGRSTQTGGFALYKITYTGDYRALNYAPLTSNGTIVVPNEPSLSWVNITRASQGLDMRQQILSSVPSYNESLYGSLSSLNFIGFAGDAGVLYKQISAQESPAWMFFFNGDGTFRNYYFSLNGTGIQNSRGMRFGGLHAAQIQLNRGAFVSNGVLWSNPAMLYGGPFLASVQCVYKSGICNPNTSLPAGPDGSYDAACPTGIDPSYVLRGATGNNCVRVQLASQPCSAFATAQEIAATPCPSNPAQSWIGVPIDIGDGWWDWNKQNNPAGGDNEHFTIITTPTSCGGFCVEFYALRDSSDSYCCRANAPRGRQCLGSDAQATHATGMIAVFTWDRSCTTLTNDINSDGTYITENLYYDRGHAQRIVLNTGRIQMSTIDANNAYASLYDSLPTLSQTRNRFLPRYPDGGSDIGNSMQSYVTAGGTSAVSPFKGVISDKRFPAGGLGLTVEYPNQLLGDAYTLTLQGGTTGVYKISNPTGTIDVKTRPIVSWAGRYNIRDISSPVAGNTITDATPFTQCYALFAGECRAGSLAGDFYVSVPLLETSTAQCLSGQITSRTLCSFSINSVWGSIMYMDMLTNDTQGVTQRRLGYGITRPGSMYPYGKAATGNDGRYFLWINYQNNSQWSPTVYAPISTYQDTQTRIGFVPYYVTGGSNITVKFGYNTSFHCTSRAEACYATSSTIGAVPFKYASESGAKTAISNVVAVPLIPGRVAYLSINDGPLIVVGIP